MKLYKEAVFLIKIKSTKLMLKRFIICMCVLFIYKKKKALCTEDLFYTDPLLQPLNNLRLAAVNMCILAMFIIT